MNEPNLFVFEIIFDESHGFDSVHGAVSLKGRSVIVAIGPERMARFMGVHHSSEVDRSLAEETAQQLAFQTIQEDLPDGFVPRSASSVFAARTQPEQNRQPVIACMIADFRLEVTPVLICQQFGVINKKQERRNGYRLVFGWS